MTTTETLNTVKELSIKGMERMNSLTELNMSLFDRMAAQQMDALNMLMEHGNRTLTMASDAKGYNTFLKGQIEAATDLSEQVMAKTKSTLTLAGKPARTTGPGTCVTWPRSTPTCARSSPPSKWLLENLPGPRRDPCRPLLQDQWSEAALSPTG